MFLILVTRLFAAIPLILYIHNDIIFREGQPVAAKRMSLLDIKFPYAFELNSDDLVFPYTKEAYLASEQRKDSIALTVILSPDGLLASTEGVRERIGFALSEPVQVAGTFGRTTANIQVNGKIDTKLYSDSERKLLSEMDRQLDIISTRSLNNAGISPPVIDAALAAK